MQINFYNYMKFRFFSSLAATVLLFGSCAFEETSMGTGSVTAVIENDDTRTSVSDGGSFTWSSGDKVWLHTTTGGVVGTLSSGEGTSSASFTYGVRPYILIMTGIPCREICFISFFRHHMTSVQI